MKPEPAIFEDPDLAAQEAEDAEAIAEFEAHGGIPHEEMKAWLLSWGTPNELPPPRKS